MGKKIKRITRIQDNQPAYDIEVDSKYHTYKLSNDVFVHNSLRIPKQYLGDTDDATGFNGGTSLSIVSSRYAKSIKRIQATMVQTITDAINLLLLDKGLDTYVNNFTIHMMPPTTQEEIDRRESIASKISISRDVLDLLSDIDDPVAKLKITKDLLQDIVYDPDIMEIIQEQIDKMEKEGEEEDMEESGDDDFMSDSDFGSSGGGSDFGMDFGGDLNSDMSGSDDFGSDDFGSEDFSSDMGSDMGSDTGSELPSMSDAGIDFADANAEI